MKTDCEQRCSDCISFSINSEGNCKIVGYGPKANNKPCDMYNNPKTYTVLASCSNCDFSSAVIVDVGLAVREIKCPECRCLTLSSSPIHTNSLGAQAVRIGTKLSELI